MNTYDPEAVEDELLDPIPIPGQLELAAERAAPTTLFGTDDPVVPYSPDQVDTGVEPISVG